MDWVKYAKQNRTALNMRFQVLKQRNPKSDWYGFYSRHISLWINSRRARLYVPLSLVSDAGYIDLIDHTIHQEIDLEGAAEKLQEVFDYIEENAK